MYNFYFLVRDQLNFYSSTQAPNVYIHIYVFIILHLKISILSIYYHNWL